MLLQRVKEHGHLTDTELADFVAEAFSGDVVDGKRLLCIIPDHTRSMPMPAMFRALCDALCGPARSGRANSPI